MRTIAFIGLVIALIICVGGALKSLWELDCFMQDIEEETKED